MDVSCYCSLRFCFAVRGGTFIGLERVDASQYGFEWIDGTSVNDSYSNWADGEPSNNLQEDCVVLEGIPKQWQDNACTGPRWYICQRKTGESRNQTEH